MRYRYTISLARWLTLVGWGGPMTLAGMGVLAAVPGLEARWQVPGALLGLLLLFYAAPVLWAFARAAARARGGWIEVTETAFRRVDPFEPAPERAVEVPWRCILDLSRYRVGLRAEHWAFTYQRPDGQVGVVHVEPEGLRRSSEVWEALVQKAGLLRLAADGEGECYTRPGGTGGMG